MGCASSKQKKPCPHCHNHPMTRRSFSLHTHQSPPERTTHVAALSNRIHSADETKTEGTSILALMEAKTWSNMMNEKIPKIVPKTPITTPPGEPETLNLWEIMEGLEDISPFTFNNRPRSFSFDVDETIEKREKVVVYFTSLRGVRKTYEDCCEVREILKALGARVDERDVSMDSGFKKEIKNLLGDGFNGGFPKVFVGEMFVGGAEEIRRLHEDGKLENLLRKCDKVEDCDGCEVCGDLRFLPCETCFGSCKIYCEKEEEEDDENGGERGFQRCSECNENGLVRCPVCCC